MKVSEFATSEALGYVHISRVHGAAGMHGLATAQIYGPPQTQTYAPARLLQKVGINQKMGAQIPLDLPFVDESGQGCHASPVFWEAGDPRTGVLPVPLALQHGLERCFAQY